MRHATATLLLGLLGGVALAGCAASSSGPATQMLTLVVDENGIHPGPELTLARFGSVCWLNGFSGGQKIRVRVERTIGASKPCVTLLGFEELEGRAISGAFGVNRCSVLCFHEPGEFAYEVEFGGDRVTGRVVVSGGPE